MIDTSLLQLLVSTNILLNSVMLTENEIDVKKIVYSWWQDSSYDKQFHATLPHMEFYAVLNLTSLRLEKGVLQNDNVLQRLMQGFDCFNRFK